MAYSLEAGPRLTGVFRAEDGKETIDKEAMGEPAQPEQVTRKPCKVDTTAPAGKTIGQVVQVLELS